MRAMDPSPHAISVAVATRYIEDSSHPDAGRYVFAYTVTLRNTGRVAARLLRRHWIVTDANGHVEEVEGEGVIGEQPRIAPGERYQYTSGAVLATPVARMEGRYQMLGDDGHAFEAPVPAFALSIPRVLH